MSYPRGTTATLEGEYTDGSGSFVNPTTPRVSILNPSGTTVVSDATPTNDSLGHYHYDYGVSSSALLGTWIARWTGTILGSPVTGDDEFEVVDSATGLVTPAQVAEHVGATTLSVGDSAALTNQIALYQAELEAILGRGVEMITRTDVVPILSAPYVDDWSYDPFATTPYNERWYARRGPVHSITSVTSGATTLPNTNYTRTRDGAELLAGTMTAGTDLTVIYVGGWDAPDNLPAKNAILARTGRWWNKRTDDDVGTESSSVEGHSVKWMPDAFTEQELAACSRLRAPDMVG